MCKVLEAQKLTWNYRKSTVLALDKNTMYIV